MTGTTDDRNDPRLTHGVDDEPVSMADVYLVLSDEERAKGFVRPVRRSYVHVGRPGPRFPLANLTDEQRERYPDQGYVAYEAYVNRLPGGGSALGRFWTQAELDAIDQGCGAVTTMGEALAETYAREPAFYAATFCVRCSMHRPVGPHGEFVWDGTTERVGT
jgi:hypothetical protein